MLATSLNQVGQLGRIPFPVHYFFCLFNKNVEILQRICSTAVAINIGTL